MADITITFADGTSHVYENVPNDVTREQATGAGVAGHDGGE